MLLLTLCEKNESKNNDMENSNLFLTASFFSKLQIRERNRNCGFSNNPELRKSFF
jgi:hypothetical protein